MNKKLNKKRNSVVFSVSLPTEHDDLYRIIERFVLILSTVVQRTEWKMEWLLNWANVCKKMEKKNSLFNGKFVHWHKSRAVLIRIYR